MTLGWALLAAGLAGLIVAEANRSTLGKWLTKPVASTGFLLLAWAAGAAESAYGCWILAGLVLSWFGDVFLIPKAQRWFRAGLVSFLLGHVAYVAAFVSLGLEPVGTAAATAGAAAIGAVVYRALSPHLGAMARPVVAYVAVISAMIVGAIGTVGAPAGALRLAGAGLFYVSDLAVARERFVASGLINRAVGLPLYYGGQALLALSVAPFAGG